MEDGKTQSPVAFKKRNDAKRIVYGEVLVPDVADRQGDLMTSDEVEKAAHKFLLKHGESFIQHVEKAADGSGVVESFVARPDDAVFTPGSWVIGFKCSPEIWDKVLTGEFTGFSVAGQGYRREVD